MHSQADHLVPQRGMIKMNSFKLEFLALTWAVTKKLAEYLYCTPFLVYTDNNPLVHLTSAKLGCLEQRWAARLVSFQFEIKFKPGYTNQSTDAFFSFPPRGTYTGFGGSRRVARDHLIYPHWRNCGQSNVCWCWRIACN